MRGGAVDQSPCEVGDYLMANTQRMSLVSEDLGSNCGSSEHDFLVAEVNYHKGRGYMLEVSIERRELFAGLVVSTFLSIGYSIYKRKMLKEAGRFSAKTLESLRTLAVTEMLPLRDQCLTELAARKLNGGKY